MSADHHAADQRRLTGASKAGIHPNNKEILVIAITRRQAREIRAVFRRALGISSRSLVPPLHVQAGPDGLSIRCRSSMAAVEFREAGEFAEARLALPFEALAGFEGGRTEPVSLAQEGDQIIARWNNGQVPQVGRYEAGDSGSATAWWTFVLDARARQPYLQRMPADPLQNRDRIRSLVESFRARLPELRGESTTDAQIRLEFLDRFWEALGWDVRNKAGKSEAEKDVVIEGHVGTIEAGRTRSRRSDYLFRIDGFPRFFVEAKKPAVDLGNDKDANFQAKTYAWNARIPFAIVTDFEEFRLFDATPKPYYEEPQRGRVPDAARTPATAASPSAGRTRSARSIPETS